MCHNHTLCSGIVLASQTQIYFLLTGLKSWWCKWFSSDANDVRNVRVISMVGLWGVHKDVNTHTREWRHGATLPNIGRNYISLYFLCVHKHQSTPLSVAKHRCIKIDTFTVGHGQIKQPSVHENRRNTEIYLATWTRCACTQWDLENYEENGGTSHTQT